MRFDFLDRRGAERFAELLDESHRRRHEAGGSDERLSELVAIGHGLSAARSGVQVDPEFRVGLRAMLVATAERDGIGATDSAVEPEPVPARAGLLGRGSARRIRARGAIVIGVAAGAMAVSGISAASENAAPGDTLYPVKRQAEKAQLAMAGSDLTRGQLSLDFARTRLAEAVAMKGADLGFLKVLDDMDSDTRQGVRLLTGSAVTRKETTPLNTVDGFAGTQRQTLEPVLGRLSPVNRDRAARSVALLEEVRQRAAGLRAGLGCAQLIPAGSDYLGPKPAECAVVPQPDAVVPSDKPQTRPERPNGKATGGTNTKDERVHPKPVPSATTATPRGTTAPEDTGGGVDDERSGPGVDTVDPVVPDVTPSAAAPAPSASTRSAKPKDPGLLDGVVGGILGG